MIKQETKKILTKWVDKLQLDYLFDVELQFIDDDSYFETGHYKVDIDDKKAVIFIKEKDLSNVELENIILRDLLYLKLYPLDITTHELIDKYYQIGDEEYKNINTKYSSLQELIVDDLVNAFIYKIDEENSLYNNKRSPEEIYEYLRPFDVEEIK